MIRKIIAFLFIMLISIFLAGIWNVWNCIEKPICNEVVHTIKPPSFTAEQKQIIDKHRKIIYSKLLHPDTYFIYSAEEFPDKIYKITLLPLELLQSYYQVNYSLPLHENAIGNCGNVMSINEDTWFVFDDSGNILMSRYIGRDSVLVEQQ